MAGNSFAERGSNRYLPDTRTSGRARSRAPTFVAMKLLVAIHDVTPAHAVRVKRLWEMCEVRGLHPALLIAPSWDGDWPLEDCPNFAGWLRTKAAAGAEVFLQGQGELPAPDAPAAATCIQRGLARLRALGFTPIGFVGSEWLAGSEGRRAVAEAGLGWSEDDRAVYLHNRGMRIDSPVLQWSARTAWRARIQAVLAATASWRLRRESLVRIALHPQDLADAATVRSVEQTLDHWVGQRTPWSYAAL
jgi:predicted deacetylase